MRPVIYNGDLGELLAKYQGQHAGRNQECVALVQGVTNIGHTSGWQRGERVVDQNFIVPGTVVANFKTVDGKVKFPNQSGWHVAIFLDFGNKKPEGGYTHFWVLDQWNGKGVKRRNKNAFSPEQAKRLHIKPCDNANEYYIVMVK